MTANGPFDHLRYTVGRWAKAEPAAYLSSIGQTRQALTTSFVPQRLDRIEACCLAGGIIAKEDPHRGREQEPSGDRGQ